jgi:hypothetical protein
VGVELGVALRVTVKVVLKVGDTENVRVMEGRGVLVGWTPEGAIRTSEVLVELVP